MTTCELAVPDSLEMQSADSESENRTFCHIFLYLCVDPLHDVVLYSTLSVAVLNLAYDSNNRRQCCVLNNQFQDAFQTVQAYLSVI